MDKRLKTPITYYGGKQSMLAEILPRIPEHNTYVEPFIGGAAVFFAKDPAPLEIINDLNGEIVNFYFCLKVHFKQLQKLVQSTPHSRQRYKDAKIVYEHPHLFDRIRRAWALWTLTNMGFAGKIGSWGFDKQGKSKVGLTIHNKRLNFGPHLTERLDTAQIECDDALRVIESRDSEVTFHYVDPPYVDSNCGHYGGYTRIDFEALLMTLASLEGKFLLSSYPSVLLESHRAKNGWYKASFEKNLSASKTNRRKKVEVLTGNYLV